jgi:AI-2 transport protein TqsA
VLAISLLIGVIVLLAVVLLASLGTSLNELARTLPQYRNYLYEPMQTVAPWLQRFGFTVSVVELNKYIDPNAVMTLVTGCSQLSNAMSSIFLLLLTVVFMLLEVPQLPAKLQQLMSRPVEGMGAIQRAG